MSPEQYIIDNWQYFTTDDFYFLAGKILVIVIFIGIVLWAADQLLSPISAMPFGIVGFFGKRGSGKSFAAVTYARRWRHFNPHKPVYTNLEKLTMPGDGPVYLDCDHETIANARDCLVLIDEAGVWLNAWNFVNKEQRKIARWIAATRHYKVMIVMTAHVPETINKRVRDVIDEFVVMEPFTTLKLFRGKVYESSVTFGREGKSTHSIWVPMWPTTCKSYNTDSLRIQAERAGVNMIGTDDEISIISSSSSATSSTTTSPTPTPAAPTTRKRKPSIAQQIASAKEIDEQESAIDNLDMSDPEQLQKWLAMRRGATSMPKALADHPMIKQITKENKAEENRQVDEYIKQRKSFDPWIQALEKAKNGNS